MIPNDYLSFDHSINLDVLIEITIVNSFEYVRLLVLDTIKVVAKVNSYKIMMIDRGHKVSLDVSLSKYFIFSRMHFPFEEKSNWFCSYIIPSILSSNITR